MSDNSILCYSAAVKKQLQAETLTQSLNQLVLYNETLQARFENGKYVPDAREPQTDEFLSIHDGAGKSPAEIDALIGQVVEKLAGEMRCERGASIRAALLNIDKDSNKLLLLSHRAIVDQRGLVLIFEDLYRIYEQLSNGQKVALRPVRKTYMEFIKEAAAARGAEFGDPSFGGEVTPDSGASAVSGANRGEEAGPRKTGAFSVVLDKQLKRQLLSWRIAEFGLAPAEAFAGALLRAFAKTGKSDSVSICVKSDYRFVDETLMRTAGAMTRTYTLPSDFAEKRELLSNVKKLRGILRDIPLHALPKDSPQFSKSSNTDRRLRLNLEYLTAEPWLGGDEWLPEGFMITGKNRVTGNYSIEIIPVLLSDGVEILIEHEETPEALALVDALAADLVPELESVLRYCEGYVEAEEFWVREFAKAATQTKLEIESDGRKETDRGRASWPCKVERSVMDRALLNVEADESQLLLAAYGVLASRLNGCEDLALLCALDRDGMSEVFPLRLNPAWTSSFKLFVEQVKVKLRQAAALGQYAFDILGEEQLKQGRPYPALDVGYVCKRISVKESVERPAIGLPAFNQAPDLALEVSQRDGDLDLRFVYEMSRFGAEIVERLSVYLNAILEDVAADANIKLGDFRVERDQAVHDVASTLAQEAFNF